MEIGALLHPLLPEQVVRQTSRNCGQKKILASLLVWADNSDFSNRLRKTMIHLKVIAGPHSGLELVTRDTVVRLGRSKNCQLALGLDDYVSREHGEIYRSGAELRYRDRNSKSGSVIDSGGKTTDLGILLPSWPLRNRDKIKIGASLIRVEWSELPLPMADDRLESSSIQNLTVLGQRFDDAPEMGAEAGAIERFLRLPESDLSDIGGVRTALSRAFLDAFEDMSIVAIVVLKAPFLTRN